MQCQFWSFFMRFFISILLAHFVFSSPALAESIPDVDSFLSKTLQKQPTISRQIYLVQAAKEQVRATGSSRASELEIRGGSSRLSGDTFVDVVEVELSRPFPGAKRVSLDTSLASLDARRQQLELERIARNFALELRTEMLSLWRLNQLIPSLKESQAEWERILQAGEEMARDGHVALGELQPYRLSLLQIHREIRSLTREKRRYEKMLEQWVGTEVPPPVSAGIFQPPEHDCTELDTIPPVRIHRVDVEIAETSALAAEYSGREEPRVGVFMEHEREENGESGQMMGLFCSLSLPYRAESAQRRAAQYQQEAAREELQGSLREWKIEMSVVRDEIDSVQETTKWFDTELLPQAREGVVSLHQAEDEGRVTPLEPAFARVEELMLKRERLDHLHRLYVLQAQAHRWCGPDLADRLYGENAHD